MCVCVCLSVGVCIDSKTHQLEHFMKIVFRLCLRVNIPFNINVEFAECHFAFRLVPSHRIVSRHLFATITLANKNCL